MEPAILDLSTSLPMGSTLPDPLQPEPLLARLKQASATQSHDSSLQTDVHAAVQQIQAQHSLPAPDDLSHAARCTRARIRSCSMSSSSATFTTLPTRYNHARIHPTLWLTMVDIRIGHPLFPGHTFCPKCATRPGATPLLDPFGAHAFKCKIVEGATRRHNALRDALALTILPIHAP